MADIENIIDGEEGLPVRNKLNETIAEANKVRAGVDSGTGSTDLEFTNIFGKIYNAAAPSGASAVTLSSTNAVAGAVVAYYNDGSAEPTVTPTPSPKAGTWVSGQVNVYWFMWDGTNFTQNIQTKAPVILPTLNNPTYSLVAGAVPLELDYNFLTVDGNATGGVFEISIDPTFLSGNEPVSGYSFGVNGSISQYNSLALLDGVTYYTRLKSTAPNFNDSGFVAMQATAASVSPPQTPTNFSIIKNGNNFDLSWDDQPVSADNYIVERGLLNDYSDATQIYSGATNSFIDVGTAANDERYYFRVKAQLTGQTDSGWAIDNAYGGSLLFKDTFYGSILNPDNDWTITNSDIITIYQNNAILFTDDSTGTPSGGANIMLNHLFDSSTDLYFYIDIDEAGLTDASVYRNAAIYGDVLDSRVQLRRDPLSPYTEAMALIKDAGVNGTETALGVPLDGQWKLKVESGSATYYKWDGVSSWGSALFTDTITNDSFFIQLTRGSAAVLGNVWSVKGVLLSSQDFNNIPV